MLVAGELRDETKRLENEFASALFQLGNRVGDGIPTELAFSKVAETMEGMSGINAYFSKNCKFCKKMKIDY